MSLTSRILPSEEWASLPTELGHVVLPHNATVLVVERDGVIVASWAVLPLLHYHLEGLEIVPAERGNTSVARRLLTAMRQHVESLGVPSVLTGSQTPDMATMLASVGAVPADMTLYSWPVEN